MSKATERTTLDAYNYAEQEEVAARAYAGTIGKPIEYVAGDVFEEAYNGRHRSPEDFAEYLAETTGQLDRDDWLHGYIDWAALVDDLRHDYTFIEAPDGDVFVFRSI